MESLKETVKITSMILLVILGSLSFSQIMAFTGSTTKLVSLASDLPVHPIIVVLIMQVTLLILGTFLDGISMMMITVPLYFPVIKALGYDPVWFAILMLINVEMGTTSPPFGVLLFIMKGIVPDATMKDVYLSALPFLLCDSVAIGFILGFPALVLWLPGLIG